MSNNSAAYVATLRGLTAKMVSGFQAAAPFYPRLCMMAKSNGRDENYGILGEVPQMQEWLGPRQAKTLRGATYLLTNREFEATVSVEKNDIDDDRMSLYDLKFTQVGSRAATHPDKLLMQTVVAGASTQCFDGQYFFDTDHAFGDSGSQSNALTYNASNHAAVTTAEFKAAFRAAIKAMLAFKDDQGEPINQPTFGRLKDLVCVVPIDLRDQAIEAFEQVIMSNDTNVVIDRPEVVTSAFMTDGTKFQVYYLGDIVKPFIFQQRRPLKTWTKGENDPERRDVLFGADARYAIGYGAWWNAVETTFN